MELFSSNAQVDNVTNIMLPQDTDTNILTVNTTLTVIEDQRYTAVVSFINLAGEFNTTSEIQFSKLKICTRFNTPPLNSGPKIS